MGNFLKINNKKIAIFVFLILNQFLNNAYALNFKRIDMSSSNANNLQKSFNKRFKNLLAEKINSEDAIFSKEIEDLEKFVEETFDSHDLDDFVDQIKQLPEINNNSDLLEKEIIKEDTKVKKIQKKEKNLNSKVKKRKDKFTRNLKQNSPKELPLPGQNIISSSQFRVPSRGYVNLQGPKITLNLKSADPIETLKLIGKLGNYGIVIIGENKSENDEISVNSKISAIFNEVDISDAINSVLNPKGVSVVMEGRHMCMQMRGVEKQNSFTSTSAMSGQFKKSAETRSEFLSIINRGIV